MSLLPAPYRFTPLSAEDRREVVDLDTMIFPGPHSVDDLLTAPDDLPWERMWGIRHREELVAVHGTYPLTRYPVPGSHARCGWLTWVGVHPGHRRRGLLSAMIAHHFAECREQGEAISGLFAAEPGIYGRFGYGLAARHAELRLPRRAALRPVPGSEELGIRIEEYRPARHADLISDLHARAGDVGLGRPGWATWETPGLLASRTAVTPALSAGREPLRILIAYDDGAPVGYATFHRSITWEPAGPEGSVNVHNLAALTAAATRRMWGVLLDLDLTSEVTTAMIALDDPLLDLLVDIRRASPRFQDNTWLRILDLPRALGTRRLVSPVEAVVEVRDALIPENSGCWRICAGPGEHPEVARTGAAPHVSIDIRDLSATFLGGASLMQFVTAGLAEAHDQGRAAALATALGWPLAPVVNWVF